MINLCTAVTQFSGVLYPCKHQAWPRDTQVNILVKWYPVSLYVSIDFLAAARNTTYRCRDPPADFASSMSYFTLMVKAALMYIYTCGQVGGTLYIVAPHKLRVDQGPLAQHLLLTKLRICAQSRQTMHRWQTDRQRRSRRHKWHFQCVADVLSGRYIRGQKGSRMGF